MTFDDIVDVDNYDPSNSKFVSRCTRILNEDGVLCLPGYLTSQALKILHLEAVSSQEKAFYCETSHSVYLTSHDTTFPDDHPKNRQVISSKGIIGDDDVSKESVLRVLYDSEDFRGFIKSVTGETSLHSYTDPLSSINIHYAKFGQELGWHFDNSEFAITLLIHKPEKGSRFEFVKNLRDSKVEEMNFQRVGQLLNGEITPQYLPMEPGTLVLFRGRDSIHRVSPNESEETRMLAVLAYNSQPGVELSKSARMTFFGRLS